MFDLIWLCSLTSRWICGVRFWSQCLIQQDIQTLTCRISTVLRFRCWWQTAQHDVKYGFYLSLFSGLLMKQWPYMMRWVIDTFILMFWGYCIKNTVNKPPQNASINDSRYRRRNGTWTVLGLSLCRAFKKKNVLKKSCIFINHKNLLYMQHNFPAKVWEINQSSINGRLFMIKYSKTMWFRDPTFMLWQNALRFCI